MNSRAAPQRHAGMSPGQDPSGTGGPSPLAQGCTKDEEGWQPISDDRQETQLKQTAVQLPGGSGTSASGATEANKLEWPGENVQNLCNARKGNTVCGYN